MNYYIDFDNTLYNTPELLKKMLTQIISAVPSNTNCSIEEITDEFKSSFESDIYLYTKHIAKKYSLNPDKLLGKINQTILDGENLVFEDSIPFLEKLKEAGHSVYMLTFSKYNLTFQTMKVVGSGLSPYFDSLIITATPKYELDINYKNGIFIDDNPSDLLGLYSKKPQSVIRIKRDGIKYSKINLQNHSIKEYKDFSNISIPIFSKEREA